MADAAGYCQLFEFARVQVPGRRCWAVEGAGSYGAGLAAFLQARGERVVEVGRPKRPPRRTKSTREIRRLKRAVARQFFKLLEHHDRSAVEVLRA